MKKGQEPQTNEESIEKKEGKKEKYELKTHPKFRRYEKVVKGYLKTVETLIKSEHFTLADAHFACHELEEAERLYKAQK